MASVVAKGKEKASEVEKGKDKDKANWDTKAQDIWVDVFVAEARAATGARAWAPTSGELPPMYENFPTENDDDAGSDESEGDDLRAYKEVECGNERQFGAVIVRKDEVVVSCHNIILRNMDPTGHADMQRLQQLERHKLVYGAKAEASIAFGFDSSIAVPKKGTSFYLKAHLEVKRADGEGAVIAEQVFEKTGQVFHALIFE
ncbi:hypothetical protein L1049_001442 [Liquidambar formosana]|uniref:Uncharacterized protein n=1 Tax=Liquidambar formosana TaxID=63359 RepID=A0AAP0NE99_LIQFO